MKHLGFKGKQQTNKHWVIQSYPCCDTHVPVPTSFTFGKSTHWFCYRFYVLHNAGGTATCRSTEWLYVWRSEWCGCSKHMNCVCASFLCRFELCKLSICVPLNETLSTRWLAIESMAQTMTRLCKADLLWQETSIFPSTSFQHPRIESRYYPSTVAQCMFHFITGFQNIP